MSRCTLCGPRLSLLLRVLVAVGKNTTCACCGISCHIAHIVHILGGLFFLQCLYFYKIGYE